MVKKLNKTIFFILKEKKLKYIYLHANHYKFQIFQMKAVV